MLGVWWKEQTRERDCDDAVGAVVLHILPPGTYAWNADASIFRLVVEKTRIPVPEIVAYDLGDTSGPPLSSFLILRYVQGERLSYARLKTLSDEQRTRLDTSLADIHIQLRRLEFLVANALENWTDMDWFAFRYTNWKCYKGVDLKERVGSFIDADPARRVLMARKFREGLAYKAEVDQLRNDGLADTKSSTNEHTSIEP